MDVTLLSYEVLQFAVVYNLILFLVWLVLVRREGGLVSEIYMIVMALFAARLWGVMFGIRARLLRYENHGEYIDFMSGFWWDLRLAPEAIVFLVLGVILTRRFIRSYIFKNPEYRRKNGRRKSDRE